MILNVTHIANWEHIKQRKQTLINKNNARENSKRIPHEYKQGDKVLLARGTEFKYEAPYAGPYEVLASYDNGTVRIQKGAVADTVNLRRLHPYFEPTMSNHGGECNRQRTPLRRSQRLLTAEL